MADEMKRKRILYANVSLSRAVDIDRAEWEAQLRERLGPLGQIDEVVTAEVDEERLKFDALVED